MDTEIHNIKGLDSSLISLNPWKSSIQHLDSGVSKQLPLAQVTLVTVLGHRHLPHSISLTTSALAPPVY